jgi:hypothetical protein
MRRLGSIVVLLACGAGSACGGGAELQTDAGPDINGDLACDPVLQNGCGDGLRCTLIVSDPDAGPGRPGCFAQGSLDVGQDCVSPTVSGAADDCRAGSYCYVGKCHEMCNVGGAGCSDGTCIGFANLEFDLCLPNCDPLAQDCPDTPGGSPQGCYLTTTGSVCAAIFGGDGVAPSGSCSFVNDCERGAGCFGGTPGVCHKYCDIEACPPDELTQIAQPCADYCAAGEVCQRILGQSGYGACVPE